MVGFRDGVLVVVAPAGESFTFGVDAIWAAEELSAAITLGLAELRRKREVRGLRSRRPPRPGRDRAGPRWLR